MRIEKPKIRAIGGLVKHDLRFEGDGLNHKTFDAKSRKIDPARTNENFLIERRGDKLVKVPTSLAKQKEVFEDIKAVKKQHKAATGRNLRKDASFASCVVTLPHDWPPDVPPEAFFAMMYEFHDKKCPGRVMFAVVHMDETTPHMHILIAPEKEDGRLSYNDVFNRRFYSEYHSRAQEYVSNRGYPCSILLDEQEKLERLLSNVPQEELDDVRSALLAPVRKAQRRLDNEKAAMQDERKALDREWNALEREKESFQAEVDEWRRARRFEADAQESVNQTVSDDDSFSYIPGYGF